MESVEQLNVVIVGGTHGNELTGVHLASRWEAMPLEIQRQGLEVNLYLANNDAIQKNRRYIDADLNRQFSVQDLENDSLAFIEAKRAKQICQQLGGKPSAKYDFIIDLHTTTANMGITLVINGSSKLALSAAAYVKQQLPKVNILHHDVANNEDSFLISLGKCGGIIVEVGPIAQGLLKAEIFEQTRQTVELILDYLSRQQSEDIALPSYLEAYQFVEKVKMPEDSSGNLIGMVHSDLQDKDFEPLAKGQAIFMLQTGQSIYYDSAEGMVAAFINEAAYYDQHHGFSLLKPVQLPISS